MFRHIAASVRAGARGVDRLEPSPASVPDAHAEERDAPTAERNPSAPMTRSRSSHVLALAFALAVAGAGLCCAGCEAIAGYSDTEQLVAEGDGGPCPRGALLCDGGLCVDPSLDTKNCGGCGVSCGSSQTCASGVCACTAPMSACGSSCVDLLADKSNCATCGHRCGPFQRCVAGKCGF
jgi:hypothetical protein